jgi:hypothetical protein
MFPQGCFSVAPGGDKKSAFAENLSVQPFIVGCVTSANAGNSSPMIAAVAETPLA